MNNINAIYGSSGHMVSKKIKIAVLRSWSYDVSFSIAGEAVIRSIHLENPGLFLDFQFYVVGGDINVYPVGEFIKNGIIVLPNPLLKFNYVNMRLKLNPFMTDSLNLIDENATIYYDERVTS